MSVMTVRESVVLTANKTKYVLTWFRKVIIKFPLCRYIKLKMKEKYNLNQSVESRQMI